MSIIGTVVSLSAMSIAYVGMVYIPYKATVHMVKDMKKEIAQYRTTYETIPQFMRN